MSRERAAWKYSRRFYLNLVHNRELEPSLSDLFTEFDTPMLRMFPHHEPPVTLYTSRDAIPYRDTGRGLKIGRCSLHTV